MILGVVNPDSRKSLSPVRRISAFALIAALKIGRSFTSRIFSSKRYSSVGMGTNSNVISASEKKRYNAGSLCGNFLEKFVGVLLHSVRRLIHDLDKKQLFRMHNKDYCLH